MPTRNMAVVVAAGHLERADLNLDRTMDLEMAAEHPSDLVPARRTASVAPAVDLAPNHDRTKDMNWWRMRNMVVTVEMVANLARNPDPSQGPSPDLNLDPTMAPGLAPAKARDAPAPARRAVRRTRNGVTPNLEMDMITMRCSWKRMRSTVAEAVAGHLERAHLDRMMTPGEVDKDPNPVLKLNLARDPDLVRTKDIPVAMF